MGTKIIWGDEIKIEEPMDRYEAVTKIVKSFIEFEKDKKGKGINFRYPVETFSNGEKLYIHRPGRKWNFDFKVIVPPEFGLKEGTHPQIAFVLRDIYMKNKECYTKIWEGIKKLYHSEEYDVNKIMREIPSECHKIKLNDEKTIEAEVLLKVVKWLFFMEDIIYWNYEGRAFLFNFLNYVINSEDEEKLEEDIENNRVSPRNLRGKLKKMGLEWEDP